MISIAALNVGGTTARGNLRSDPGGFTGTLALAGGGVDGTLAFAPVGNAQKIEAHLTASSAQLPRRACSAQRPDRRHHPAGRRADDADRRGRGAGAGDGRAQPCPAHRQRQPGQRLRPGARGTCRPARGRVRIRHARQCRARPHQPDRPRQYRAPGAGARASGGADPRRRRRLGAGADPAVASPAAGRRFRATAARGPRSTPSSPRCRWKCSISAGPTST